MEALKRIFPDVNAHSVVGRIVMPGHPFASDADKAESEAETTKLHDLIAAHDVTYVLTDTRESRWLPAVICSSLNKLCVNVALGLESYLVIRHGDGPASESPQPPPPAGEALAPPSTKPFNLTLDPHPRLSCYFCSDVTPPQNSTLNRTLDQQCTVTRPGLAPIASSLAVEMVVSLLHRKEKGETSGLGQVPHMIRGDVASYQMVVPKPLPAFTQCSACCSPCISEYRDKGLSFVEDICNDLDGSVLEKVCGLDLLKKGCEEGDWDCSDDEGMGSG